MKVSLLPDPHPLDFDWRFDGDTVSCLVQRIGRGRVLLIGCPSIALALAKLRRSFLLVERQPYLDAVRQITIDLQYQRLAQLQLGVFDTILIDSPWYVDYLSGWLWEALSHSAPGGRVMFSLWPRDIRPQAAEEAEAILVQASAAGQPTVEKGFLGYQTPRFELASAAAAGRMLAPCWRRGDLISVDVTNLPLALSAPARLVAPETVWERFVFDRTQVALRVRSERDNSEPRLIELAPGGVLQDVSRRSAIRSAIDLWSSDNLAFRVEGYSHFLSALEHAMAGTPADPDGATLSALKLLLAHRVVAARRLRRTSRWQHFA